MNKDLFKEYFRESEPNKRYKGYAWHTAILLKMHGTSEIPSSGPITMI